ncbi:MAG: hypothetical protein HYX38_03800 [Rhodospirillales bacterium]|nr:hypothetical protein [Rhodospirillales bacterium]
MRSTADYKGEARSGRDESHLHIIGQGGRRAAADGQEVREILVNAMYQGYGQIEVLPIAMTCGMQCPFAGLQTQEEDNEPVRPVGTGEIVANCK